MKLFVAVSQTLAFLLLLIKMKNQLVFGVEETFNGSSIRHTPACISRVHEHT